MKEILEKYGKIGIAELVKNYDKLGLRASGNFEKKLEYEVTESKLKITGASYSYFMEKGRGVTSPNKRGKLYGIILQWIEDKKLKVWEGKTKKSMAFLISRKIDEKGIKVPNPYNAGGLITDVFNRNYFNNLSKELNREISIKIFNQWQ